MDKVRRRETTLHVGGHKIRLSPAEDFELERKEDAHAITQAELLTGAAHEGIQSAAKVGAFIRYQGALWKIKSVRADMRRR